MAQNFTINSNTDSVVSSFNIRLRSLRKSKGWSQTELGVHLGKILKISSPIPTSTIASWEHKDLNLCKIPSEDKIIALANLFHVTTDYLRGFTNNPSQTLSDLLQSPTNLKPIRILIQEIPQHIGEPLWITSNIYTGWVLLTHQYLCIDVNGNSITIDNLVSNNATFSIFPPYNIYMHQIYNKSVIPETDIRFFSKVWVTINSPDPAMQLYNGWYYKLPDESGVQGKTILSYDSYFDFWIAYDSPLTRTED